MRHMETVQADAAKTPPPAPTPSTAPANTVPPTEQAKTALVKVDASFLPKLTRAESRQLDESIRNAIPRDEHGKAKLQPGLNSEAKPVGIAEDKAPEIVTPPAPETVSTENEPEVIPPVLEPPAPETAPAPESETTLETEVPPAAPEKAPQRRVRGEKPEDDMALEIFQNRQRVGKPISMLEAALEARAVLGLDEETPAAPVAKTVEAAQSELATLREQRKAAKAEFNTDAEDTAQTAIEDKLREIGRLEQEAAVRQQAEGQKKQTAYQQSMAKAVDLYPDLRKADSKISMTKDRIWAEHKANNDPILSRQDYPLILAQMAAAEERVAPKAATTTSPKPVPPRSVQPAKPAPPLASASARTTQPGSGTPTVATLLKGMNRRELQAVNEKMAELRGA